MENVRPWCGQPSDRGRLKNRTEHSHTTVYRPFVRDCPGRPVPEETFTHSHPSWSSDILYQLPPFTAILVVLFVQFTCLTVFFNNRLQVLFGLPLGLGPSTSYCMHFFTQSSSSFHSTCSYHRSLFCCNTSAVSYIPNLSLSSLLSFSLTPHIHLNILISSHWISTSFSFLTGLSK